MVEFKDDSLLTWLSNAQSNVTKSLTLFTGDFVELLSDSTSRSAYLLSVDRDFLPFSELEHTFAGLITSTGVCSISQP